MSGLLSPQQFWAAFSDHARHTAAAARYLVEMLEDVEHQEPLAETIRKLEQRAGEIARQVIDLLEHATITPLDRDDSHALISELNSLLVLLRSAGDRIALHHLRTIRPEVVALARILAGSADRVLEAINMLTQVSNQAPLAELCRAIGEQKHHAERVLRGVLAGLFRELNDPIEIVKWRDILAAIESATCRADGVAHVIEGIVIDRV